MYFPSILAALLLVSWQQEGHLVSGQVHFKKGAPHAKLASGGLVSGEVKFSRDGRPYSSFIGIKYADIPERFQEAKLVTEATWEGAFDATKPGALCSQQPFAAMAPVFGQEDCLNLNVYVPMNNTGTGKRGYPVMVWIHGGGFNYGGGLGYGPQFFMDEDVIVVTFNYRLGIFGFMTTGDNVVPGNNGLKDQVVALKWIQENIKAFGGDPTKVTIFGESAGGAAVHYLMLSPTTKGLFHRAISQSGSALHLWSSNPTARKTVVELATYLKCPTTAAEPLAISSEEILTCLKGLPAEELNKAQFAFKTSWPSNQRSFFFAPSVEPSDPVSDLTPFITEPPISILSRKDSTLAEIPWIVGATEDEGAPMYAGVILSNPNTLKEINSDFPGVASSTFDLDKYLENDELVQAAQKLKQFYFGDKEISEENRQQLANVYSDELILHGVYKAAYETASRGKRNPVYLYQYAYKGPLSLMGMSFQLKGEEKYVGHGDDLQHLFNFGAMIPGAGDVIKADTPDEEFSKNFVRLWVSFAIHGEPKHSWGTATYNRWKAISKKELDGVLPQKWFRIDTNAAPFDIEQSVKDRMQFWDTLWSEHLTPAALANYKPGATKAKIEL